MKDNQAKYPQLRFKGFTDPWEQRKLTDISEKVTEKNSDNEFSETLTNSAEYGIISQRDFFDKDISNKKNLNTYYVVRDGDFVYNPRISNFAPVGPIKRNTLGRTGVMSPLYYIFQAHNVDGMYLGKYFSSTKWHRFMELNGDTGARADRFAIKDKDFVQMPIPLPNLEEQSKIARFFENVDNLIAANQRKLDLLKEQKKGYLQKMFPKNGAKVPELRFAGFADAWEQRKLGDYLSLPKKKKVEITNARDLMTLKLHLRGIEAGTGRETLSLGSTVYYKRLAGQFLYGKQNFFNGSMAIIPKKFDGKATSGDVPALDINGINSSYLYTYVSRHDYWKAKEGDASGTGSKRIHESTLLKFGIMVPVNNAEQQKIGSFFQQLDHLITLHQRKLEKLQELKKGYLQKMFC